MKGPHRTTPVAPAPHPSDNSKAKARLYALKAPIVVTWTTGDREHERGDLVIGRSSSADVVLDDTLVSRSHARITIDAGGGVMVEDLHSANGVYVNGVRIAKSAGPLNEGDRILIGMTELSLFSGRASGTLPIGRRMLGEPRLMPAPTPSQTPIARIEPKKRPSLADVALTMSMTTERTTVLAMISRLSNALIATGRVAEANELVAEHLKKIMLGASAGLPIPEDVTHEAAEHALALFARTGVPSWLAYAIEVYLVARRVPNLPNLVALRTAMREGGAELDAGAFNYLVESLGARFDEMSGEERARFAELAKLAGVIKPRPR